ncbi:Putative serine acetyltransferase 2 [Glycine soja]|nr:Putative serine acetyltransferase 2 [Glycine soja]
MHGVTLGGTGKEIGDRHPKVGEGALIEASATILGNIKIGEGAMIAAGSLVLKDVPPHCIAAGIPAKVISALQEHDPSLTMKHDASKDLFTHVATNFIDEKPNVVNCQAFFPPLSKYLKMFQELRIPIEMKLTIERFDSIDLIWHSLPSKEESKEG